MTCKFHGATWQTESTIEGWPRQTFISTPHNLFSALIANSTSPNHSFAELEFVTSMSHHLTKWYPSELWFGHKNRATGYNSARLRFVQWISCLGVGQAMSEGRPRSKHSTRPISNFFGSAVLFEMMFLVVETNNQVLYFCLIQKNRLCDFVQNEMKYGICVSPGNEISFRSLCNEDREKSWKPLCTTYGMLTGINKTIFLVSFVVGNLL